MVVVYRCCSSDTTTAGWENADWKPKTKSPQPVAGAAAADDGAGWKNQRWRQWQQHTMIRTMAHTTAAI